MIAYFPKIKEVTWQWPRPFQGQFVVHRLGLTHQIWRLYLTPFQRYLRGTKNIKLAPYGTYGQLLHTANFKVTWHKNWDKNQKSGPDKVYLLCLNLRICDHLLSPIINGGGGDSLWKVPIFRLQGLMNLTMTLDRAILQTVVHHSLTSTYIPNFSNNEETFCGRTDGRTDRRTDGHLRPTVYLVDSEKST